MEDFFADVPQDGDSAVLTDDSEVTTTDSQPETDQPETESPSQEGEEVTEAEPVEKAPVAEDTPEETNLPFHKHPRWQRMQREKAELQERLEQFEERLAESNTPQPVSEGKVPDHLVSVFGNNYDAYLAYEKDIEERTRKQVAAERAEEARKQQEAEQHNKRFVEWAETELSDLGHDIGVNLTDKNNSVRNEILSICEEYGVQDANGRPDFRKAWTLHQKLHPREDATEKKEVAAKTSSRSTQASAKEEEVMTPSRLRSISLNDYLN
jgi:hypothetical protein